MWESTTHYCANHRVTFDGADRAKGICDAYCIGNLADGQAAHVVASYHDDYERRGGKWAIVRRFVNQRVFSHLTGQVLAPRSEEHTSELQSLMRISYAVFCLKKKNIQRIPT